MAPKRAKVVRTTKKVVEETIEILGVACDSHESVDLPAASDSKMVEVLVEAKEGKVPIAVVVAKDKKDESETEHKQRADEGSPETEQPQQKRDGDAELVSEQRAKEKKIEPGTEQKKRANEASRETEEPLPQQKGEDDDHSKRKEEAESIADMETQEEEEEEEEEEEQEQEKEEQVAPPTNSSVPPPNALMLMRCRSAPAKGWLKRRELGGEEEEIEAKEASSSLTKEKEKEEKLVLMSYAPDFFKISTDIARETWLAGSADPLARSRSWRR